jgi:hypothetical protein
MMMKVILPTLSELEVLTQAQTLLESVEVEKIKIKMVQINQEKLEI